MAWFRKNDPDNNIWTSVPGWMFDLLILLPLVNTGFSLLIIKKFIELFFKNLFNKK